MYMKKKKKNEKKWKKKKQLLIQLPMDRKWIEHNRWVYKNMELQYHLTKPSGNIKTLANQWDGIV